MANSNVPQCQHCFGTGWNKIVVFGDKTGMSLWQCGHGHAYAEAMTNGCSRIIAATEAQMSAGGVI